MATPLFHVRMKKAEDIEGISEAGISTYLEAFPREMTLQPKGKVPKGSTPGARIARQKRKLPPWPVYAIHRDIAKMEDGVLGFITFYYAKTKNGQLHWADSRIFKVADA